MAREVCEQKSKSIIASSSGGFLYSDISSGAGAGGIQTHLVNPMQHAFEGNPEIYNLSSSMEMIGFNKNFFMKNGNTSNAPGTSSSSKSADFYPHHHQEFGSSDNLIVGADQSPWHDQNRILLDDSNIRCVFPCEGNERPSQGLSLLLSSSNPTSIGLQSFELRQTNNHHHHHHHQEMFQLRNSKFLGPAQELLNEFVSLGTKQIDSHKLKQSSKNKQWDDIDSGNGSSSRKQVLSSLEFIELQKRKAKLLSMLEEVDRRYKHYCDQMKAVVSSFESVAGFGAAAVYSALASKAMSRHFRCLRDGIVCQIQATRKAMGEKDTVAPGASRGETPRLRVLDQTLRQQRAFQQMTMMESHPWRPQRGLPERSVSVLRAWLFEHFLHPYPSDVDKHILARQTGLSRSQVSNWFINARVRLWKPMIEEMYLEELKERERENNENIASSDDGILNGDVDENGTGTSTAHPQDDQKPGPEQLVRVDSECLSSIVTNPDKNELKINHHHQQHHSFGNFGSGPIELDFSSYSHHHNPGHGGGVSLTLGLQQHAGSSGVSLAFSPASQTSLFYGREQMEDCQPLQYSLLDGEAAQHLPYRNLMGAQLLHDLAG